MVFRRHDLWIYLPAPSSGLPVELQRDHVRAPEEDSTEELDVISLFEKMYLARGTKDDHLRLKEAEAKWPQFICTVEALQLGLSPTDLIKPDKVPKQLL